MEPARSSVPWGATFSDTDLKLLAAAADNTTYSHEAVTRRFMALKQLGEEGRQELRSRLLAQVIEKWPYPSAVDLEFLSDLGNEDTAQSMISLYSEMPNVGMSVVGTRYVHTAVAKIRNRLRTHAWEIAGDRFVEVDERRKAVASLTDLERNRLQALLMVRIPITDRNHNSCAEDVQLLGDIGNAKAADWLATVNAPFKLGSTRNLAVEKIESRKNQSGQGP